MNDRIVWVDCEMTGLDLRNDALVEVAALVTDGELNVLGEGVDLVIRPPDGTLDNMDEVVQKMHAESGLINEIPDGTTLAHAEATLLEYIRSELPVARKAPLAGNSVFVDRGFLTRDMPTLEQHLHYRCIDVSGIKELVRRWYPKVYYASPAKTGNHRALGDIRDSIEELRYYRETVFVPKPGPNTDSARAAALRVRPIAPTAPTAPTA